jgi:hypothetical protein
MKLAYYRSKWKEKELNGKTVEFSISDSGLGISGVGVFKIHIHGRLISVVIEHAGNLYALFHPELVDKIQRHPNQSIACFHLAARL